MEMDDDSNPIRRPPLSIDLNEAPSSPPTDQLSPTVAASGALALVLKFHGEIVNAGGAAAEFPGEAGGGVSRTCGICGKEEVRRATVVCDGCEAGFHVACLRPRQRSQAVSGDWECGECALSGPTQKRWLLGPPTWMLDINEPAVEEEECGTNRQCVFFNFELIMILGG